LAIPGGERGVGRVNLHDLRLLGHRVVDEAFAALPLPGANAILDRARRLYVPGTMSVPTLYVPLASMVVLGAGGGGGAGSAWPIPPDAQKPATVSAAATADAFVDHMATSLDDLNTARKIAQWLNPAGGTRVPRNRHWRNASGPKSREFQPRRSLKRHCAATFS
jgi:hypothetical protein